MINKMLKNRWNENTQHQWDMYYQNYITGYMRARWKVLGLILHETRGKRPLGRDPDRSWCNRHMSTTKDFWLLPMANSSSTRARWNILGLAHIRSDMKLGTSGRWIGPRTGAGVTAKASHGSMDWAAAHSYAAADVHGAMGCGQKSFTLVWRWQQLLSGSQPNGCLSQVSCQL